MNYTNLRITAVLVAMLTLLAGCAMRYSTYDTPRPDTVTWGTTAISRAVPFDPAAAPPPPRSVTPTAELPARTLGPAAPSEVGPVTASTGETGVEGFSPYVAATPNEWAATEIGQLPSQGAGPATVAGVPLAGPSTIVTSSSAAAQLGGRTVDAAAARGAGNVAVTRTADGGVVISNLRE